MALLWYLSLLALASAAPHYHHHHRHPPFNHQSDIGDYGFFIDDVFDARRFWSELSTEMRRLDDALQEFYKHFPVTRADEGVEGNEYRISITLAGFDEKDIVVKAREGVLMIQAIHKSEEGVEKNYLDVRTLPNNVDVAGSWTYDKGVLTVVFPLKNKSETTTEVAITEGAVEKEHSREEMEDNNEHNQDADVGLRGDREKDNELLTNEIPRRNTVEATTYAVDLKNEVEFVPVRY